MRRALPIRWPAARAVLLGLTLALNTAAAPLRPGASKPAAGASKRMSAATTKARTPAVKAVPGNPPIHLAGEALTLEEHGAYGLAARALRELRLHLPPDADLDLELALDEARRGDLDAAAELLWGPVLTRALEDTLPVARRQDYQAGRDGLWINGRFDGWHWYVARARAEVAAELGRWDDATAAARRATEARPLAGKEWLILAVCAGRAGEMDVSESAARRAVFLDPTLPEAHYLAGLHDWRTGRRSAAQAEFRLALAADSTYRRPVLALVRPRLPSAMPDTLPVELLTGIRRIGLLSSSEGPKLEEQVQMDVAPGLLEEADAHFQDSLRAFFTATEMALPVLIDERGRIALHELPWFEPGRMPEQAVSLLVASLVRWRFEPAVRHGAPQSSWSAVRIHFHD